MLAGRQRISLGSPAGRDGRVRRHDRIAHKAPKADFGYILCRSHWGRGFASEAASAVVAWALAQPAIHRVWATCSPDNVRSARVLEKSGLRLEGRFAKWEARPNLGQAAGDSLVYAVTRAP